MSCCSFGITQSMWGEAIDAFQKNVYDVKKEDGCVYSLFKHGVNGICKGFALVALAVVAVATPVFALFDVIYGTVKTLFCCEVRQVNQTSILDFYRGTSTHDTDLTLDQILKKDDAWLEKEHAFIQWLFPTEQVGVNRDASLSNKETQAAFKADPKLQAQMKRAFERMMLFYGLKPDLFGIGSLSFANNYLDRIGNLISHDHNNLRITRILTSLRFHGLTEEAEHFIGMLEVLAGDPRWHKVLKAPFNGHWARAAGSDKRIPDRLS